MEADVTRKRWMVVAWAVILCAVIGFAAIDGGRNCEVPKSGFFHMLLHGEKFVPTHTRSFRGSPCRQVK